MVRDDPAITYSVTRRVRPGREQEFEGFLRGITEAVSRFPGFRGARVFRSVRGNQQYRVVVRFDRESNLRRWKASEERRAGIARTDERSEDDAAITNITGTEQERTLAPARSPLDSFAQHPIDHPAGIVRAGSQGGTTWTPYSRTGANRQLRCSEGSGKSSPSPR